MCATVCPNQALAYDSPRSSPRRCAKPVGVFGSGTDGEDQVF
jgi:hypothetical protein